MAKGKEQADAQSEEDEGVLGIAAGAKSMIPAIEGFKDRADEAGEQRQCRDAAQDLCPHVEQYSTAERLAERGNEERCLAVRMSNLGQTGGGIDS